MEKSPESEIYDIENILSKSMKIFKYKPISVLYQQAKCV